MSRTIRIIVVMAVLLLTISVGASKADASVYRCGVEVTARWDYFSNMRLTACIKASSSTNLDVWNKQCWYSAIGVSISSVTSYEWSGIDSKGRKYTVAGCRYTKSIKIPLTDFGGSTTCWVEATIRTVWYGGPVGWGTSISDARRNWC